MTKKKNKNKPQNKYAKFSKVEEPKLKTFNVAKEQIMEADKSLRNAMRLLHKFDKDGKGNKMSRVQKKSNTR